MNRSILYKTQSGAAVLATSMILLFAMTLITLFTAKSTVVEYKIQGNDIRSKQAFQAANAAIEFGVVYLDEMRNAILTNLDANGYLAAYSDSNTNNVTLSNGSQYSLSYLNTTANDINTIEVTATGLSDDGTATRIIKQMITLKHSLINIPSVPNIVKGQISLSGSAQINNLNTDKTLWAGQAVSIAGSAKTVTATDDPASDNTAINNDIILNDNTLDSMSTSDFFKSFFSQSKTDVKQEASHTFTNLGNYSSSVDNLTNSLIWITQSSGQAQINGNTDIGTQANPVILIVDGDFRVNGNVTIYGFVYITGDSNFLGNTEIYGAVVTEGDQTNIGNFEIHYDITVLDTVKTTIGKFSKIAGSWKDFS